MDETFRIYNKGGFTITTIYADNEFAPLLQPLADEHDIDLNSDDYEDDMADHPASSAYNKNEKLGGQNKSLFDEEDDDMMMRQEQSSSTVPTAIATSTDATTTDKVDSPSRKLYDSDSYNSVRFSLIS